LPSYVRRVLEAIDAISEWTGRITAFLIPGMMLIMTYEVVARYLLKSPTIWAMESTQYLFLTTTALGGAYVLRHGGHVNVPILYDRLSTRTQAIVDVVTSLFFFFFMVALFGASWITTVESVFYLEHSPTYWEPPISAGILLTILQGLAKLVRDLATAITGKVETPHGIASAQQDGP